MSHEHRDREGSKEEKRKALNEIYETARLERVVVKA